MGVFAARRLVRHACLLLLPSFLLGAYVMDGVLVEVHIISSQVYLTTLISFRLELRGLLTSSKGSCGLLKWLEWGFFFLKN